VTSNDIKNHINLLIAHLDNGDYFAASVSASLISRRVNAAYTSATLRDAKALTYNK